MFLERVKPYFQTKMEQPILSKSLRVFGISESFVYPDLDHISSDLKDSYGI